MHVVAIQLDEVMHMDELLLHWDKPTGKERCVRVGYLDVSPTTMVIGVGK